MKIHMTPRAGQALPPCCRENPHSVSLRAIRRTAKSEAIPSPIAYFHSFLGGATRHE